MGTSITSWYLQSINFSEAPTSRHELADRFESRVINSDDLLSTEKWEPVLRGDLCDTPPGWTLLENLAESRRGIATGSNTFFLINSDAAKCAGISTRHLRPCIGRAHDVDFPIFRAPDFDALAERGGRCFLLDFEGPLTSAEQRYVKSGEDRGLTDRYLLANRKPWYSMEKRPPAPIWASVFGRGELVFVFNEAGVRSLTNFHCVFPRIPSSSFAKALVVLLNSEAVRVRSKLLRRGFGGGLNKFEPRDLLGIPVPDLRCADDRQVVALASQLDLIDAAARAGGSLTECEPEIERLVALIASQAASVESLRLLETGEDTIEVDSDLTTTRTRKYVVAAASKHVVNYNK